MSRCRNQSCRRDIHWFQEDTGYHPPVENVAEVAPTEVVEQLHSIRDMYALVDGRLIPIRASGIYVGHRCNEDPYTQINSMSPTYESEFIPDVIRNTECPVCEAPKGVPCATPSGREKKAPHAARIRNYNAL